MYVVEQGVNSLFCQEHALQGGVLADPFVQALEVVLLLLSQVLAGLLGFQASANYVFVYVIAVLVMRDFSNTTKLAMMRKKVEGLIQGVAPRS